MQQKIKINKRQQNKSILIKFLHYLHKSFQYGSQGLLQSDSIKLSSLTEICKSEDIYILINSIQTNNFILNRIYNTPKAIHMKNISNDTSLAQSEAYQINQTTQQKLLDFSFLNNSNKPTGLAQQLFDQTLEEEDYYKSQKNLKLLYKGSKSYQKIQKKNTNLIKIQFLRECEKYQKQLKRYMRESFKSQQQLLQTQKKIQEIQSKKSILKYFANLKENTQQSQFSFNYKGKCIVCQDQVLMNQSFISFGCTHHFHSDCFENVSLDNINACPICYNITSQFSCQNEEMKQVPLLNEFQGTCQDSLLDYSEYLEDDIESCKSKSTNTNEFVQRIRFKVNKNIRIIEGVIRQINVRKYKKEGIIREINASKYKSKY